MLPCQTPLFEPNQLIQTILQMIFDSVSNIEQISRYISLVHVVSLFFGHSFKVTLF